MIIRTTEIITFGRMIIVVGMIIIEDGVTNIINTGMIIMAGVTEGDIATILGEEGIEDPTTATIGIIRLVIHIDHTMIDRIMTGHIMAVPLGGKFLLANCE